ncbi:MAG: SMR family transporter [Deltaproteobacteria bacterium]|jgi:drug/metabolite transporter (DMT)-like permease|nr:SMR family transporter [Deltaproteobacteria bacterium]
MLTNPYIFMGLAVIFTSIGQILQKIGSGMVKKEHLKISIRSILVFFNPFIFSALIMLFFATIFYLLALSKLPLSIAYPMLSSGYVLVVLLSKIFLKEEVSLKRWLGVFIIMIGIFVIFNSGK